MQNILETLGIEVDTEIANEELFIAYRGKQTNIPYIHRLEKEYTDTDKAGMLLEIMQHLHNFPTYEQSNLEDFIDYMSDKEVLDDLSTWYEEWKHDFSVYRRLLYLFETSRTFDDILKKLESALEAE